MDSLTAKLARIAEVRRELAKLKPLQDELDELKYEIQLEMQRNQSKRTEAASGLYAIRVVKATTRIEDPTAVEDWLEENTFNPDEYHKLDEARVKALAESRLKETGEIIPGLETTESEYVQIKEATK